MGVFAYCRNRYFPSYHLPTRRSSLQPTGSWQDVARSPFVSLARLGRPTEFARKAWQIASEPERAGVKMAGKQQTGPGGAPAFNFEDPGGALDLSALQIVLNVRSHLHSQELSAGLQLTT